MAKASPWRACCAAISRTRFGNSRRAAARSDDHHLARHIGIDQWREMRFAALPANRLEHEAGGEAMAVDVAQIDDMATRTAGFEIGPLMLGGPICHYYFSILTPRLLKKL